MGNYYVTEDTGDRYSSKPPNSRPYRVFPDTSEGYNNACAYAKMIQERLKNEKEYMEKLDKHMRNQKEQLEKEKRNQSSTSSGSSSAGLISFGLAGFLAVIVFPFWLMFWMLKWTFKLMYYMFKGLFYNIPRFLLSKGIIGKIVCGIYLFTWLVTLFVVAMGKEYVFRNNVYLLIILISIIVTTAITITFRLSDKQFTKRSIIILSSGIFIVSIVLIIGLFVTKGLIPLEGEVKFTTEHINKEKPIKNK